MRLEIQGHHLPGASCGAYDDIHVGIQVGRDPWGLVRGDSEDARWEVDLRVVETADGPDFRGPAVHGRRGERFVYLTWGVGDGEAFEMFRRGKIMLDGIPDPGADSATVRIPLTDAKGMPSCARFVPPAAEWR